MVNVRHYSDVSNIRSHKKAPFCASLIIPLPHLVRYKAIKIATNPAGKKANVPASQSTMVNGFGLLGLASATPCLVRLCNISANAI
jgi:hypothetical protein